MARETIASRRLVSAVVAVGALLLAAMLGAAPSPVRAAESEAQAIAALKALRPNGSGRTNYGLAMECQPGSCLVQQRLYHARCIEIIRRYSLPMHSSVFDRVFPQVETIAARVDAGELMVSEAERLVVEVRDANNQYIERERQNAERERRQKGQAEQQARFDLARYECERDAVTAIPRRIAPPPQRCPRGLICSQDSPEFRQGAEDEAVRYERRQLFESCMRGRGFR